MPTAVVVSYARLALMFGNASRINTTALRIIVSVAHEKATTIQAAVGLPHCRRALYSMVDLAHLDSGKQRAAGAFDDCFRDSKRSYLFSASCRSVFDGQIPAVIQKSSIR